MNDTGAANGAGRERESRLAIARGAMLYDASLIDQPTNDLFDVETWRRRAALESVAGGRGGVVFVKRRDRSWALRHYRRGGAVAGLLGDRYLWTGEDRTRAFREWRLLRELAALRLPVPRAVAARYLRRGIWYTADLLTEELPSRLTLAAALAAGPLPDERWTEVGRCLHAFHARGVCHADLNAHNVVLGEGKAYLLDFDRGRIRSRGRWEHDVLERLRRSLIKVTQGLPADRFGERQWLLLLRAARDA